MQWKRIIGEITADKPNDDDLVRRCIDTLLERDPNLRAFERMAPDIQERERFFMANSVKGFIGFFRENKTGKSVQ
jgi:hypothetical protein